MTDPWAIVVRLKVALATVLDCESTVAVDEFERLADERTSTRDQPLRRQAEDTCERRTIELEDARSALARQAEDAELGRAVRGLEAQTTRLGRTPGVPFEFTPDGAADAVANELAEVKACEPGSPAAHMELGDLLSTVISAFGVHRAPLLTTVMAATSKLERRLDHKDAGASWEDAKRADLESVACRLCNDTGQVEDFSESGGRGGEVCFEPCVCEAGR